MYYAREYPSPTRPSPASVVDDSADRFQACSTCRNRKTKCDGVRPTCGHCSRLNKHCEFTERKRKIRKPRTEALQDKIRDLQSEIRALTVASGQPLTPSGSQQLSDLHYPTPRERILAHAIFHHSAQRLRASPLAAPPDVLPFFPHPIWLSPEQDVVMHDERETYSYVVRRDIIESALTSWDTSTEMPWVLSEYLIRLFLPFRCHFRFHVKLSRFISDLHLSPSHPRAIHPGLLNVFYLIAVSTPSPSGVVSPVLASYEALFLSRARSELESALAYAEKLEQFLWGSILMGMYLARAGKLMQAWNTVSSTTAFAVACRLHLEVPPCPSSRSVSPSSGSGHSGSGSSATGEGCETEGMRMLLPPEEDQIAGEERANLWTVIYLTDRTLARSMDLPSSVPEKCVPTAEPFRGSVPSASEPLFVPSSRVRMYEGDPNEYDVRADGETTLRLKVGVLYEGCLALAAQKDRSSATFRMTFKSLASSLAAFERTLPPLTNTLGLTSTERIARANPLFFWMRCMAYSCKIALWGAAADLRAKSPAALAVTGRDFSSADDAREKTYGAACGMAQTMNGVRGEEGISPIHGGVYSLSHALTAADVLVREIVRCEAGMHHDARSHANSPLPIISLSSVVESDGASLSSAEQPGTADVEGPSTSMDSQRYERLEHATKHLEMLLDFILDLTRLYPSWSRNVEDLRALLLERN